MMTTQTNQRTGQQQRSAAAQTLSTAAKSWIDQLPSALQPANMARDFPHIANRLAQLWPSNQPCRLYFDELLLDNRGDRKGFPPKVAVELASLKSYYESAVFPSAQTVWDELAERIRAL